MDPRKTQAFATENRKNLTPSEATLWKLLKGKQLKGRKFRRQHSFGNYIVDFYCFSEKLVIELDGPIHSGQKEKDEKRDEYLRSLGLTVLRFKNRMVFEEPQNLLNTIVQNFKSLPNE
jgi:very-short-patch-repair endonuclease